MDEQTYDLLIVGGGIHGAAIARDAAGRGYSVCLVEKDDLASGTSSAATKLVHGGVRYLGRFAIAPLMEGLKERKRLWRIAPHIVTPRRLVVPHHKGLRPLWLLRLGLVLYDRLAGDTGLPPSRRIYLPRHPAGRFLRSKFAIGFETSDLMADDARLVVVTALDAHRRGARILTRTTLVAADRDRRRWKAELEGPGGEALSVSARIVVNAGGAWAGEVHRRLTGKPIAAPVRFSRGSHIVIGRDFGADIGFMFQNTDRRVVFALPFARGHTLIGSTEEVFEGDPDKAGIASHEIDYLCAVASEYLRQPVSRADVVWGYSGVQTVPERGGRKSPALRGDRLVRVESGDGAGLVDVIGGRLTTHRRMAEEVLAEVDKLLQRNSASWTASAPLPGGDFLPRQRRGLERDLLGRYPFLTPAHAQRMIDNYGTLAGSVLGSAQGFSDLGERFGDTLSTREVDYLCQTEWARTADDILFRRTKLGLTMDGRAQRALAAYLAHKFENMREEAQ